MWKSNTFTIDLEETNKHTPPTIQYYTVKTKHKIQKLNFMHINRKSLQMTVQKNKMFVKSNIISASIKMVPSCPLTPLEL